MTAITIHHPDGNIDTETDLAVGSHSGYDGTITTATNADDPPLPLWPGEMYTATMDTDDGPATFKMVILTHKWNNRHEHGTARWISSGPVGWHDYR